MWDDALKKCVDKPIEEKNSVIGNSTIAEAEVDLRCEEGKAYRAKYTSRDRRSRSRSKRNGYRACRKLKNVGVKCNYCAKLSTKACASFKRLMVKGFEYCPGGAERCPLAKIQVTTLEAGLKEQTTQIKLSKANVAELLKPVKLEKKKLDAKKYTRRARTYK